MNRPPLRDTPAAPLVFFTGGTALRALSRHLAAHAVPAVHIVTTFDSGGSTAVLRRAFAMPAVGDIRHRLGALADPAVVPPRVLDIWEWRMPQEGDPGQLRDELRALGEAWHAFWLDVPERFAAPLPARIRGETRHLVEERGGIHLGIVPTESVERYDYRIVLVSGRGGQQRNEQKECNKNLFH